MASLVFRQVSFSYPGSPVELFQSVDFGVSEGWTGIIGPNGAGKSTLLQLASGLLSTSQGHIHRPDDTAYCPQRTDSPPSGLRDLLDSVEGEAYRIRGHLEVDDDFLSRWPSLSHGERKRAQLAVSLWARPSLWAVDEPTNHLDATANAIIVRALQSYRGIGLLVSHDRDLLDTLCTHCLFVEPPHLDLRSGGYTTAKSSLEDDNQFVIEQKTRLAKEQRRLAREVDSRRRHQQKADRARSKRGISRKDHDAKEKIDRLRVADSGGGKGMRQLEGRIRQASERESSLIVRKQRATGVPLAGQQSSRNALVRLPEGRVSLGESRTLLTPPLMVQPSDRIALIGANGTGKSTLLRHLVGQIDLPPSDLVYLPQEVDAEESTRILEQVKQFRGAALGELMQWVSRLGSDPSQLLDSRLPSPGEIRKLMLAARMSDRPSLLVLDEPTNHMDLPSIECLEAALADFAGALLLVSHDLRFLRSLTATAWDIQPAPNDPDSLILHVVSQGVA